jgi:hypothetical protein
MHPLEGPAPVPFDADGDVGIEEPDISRRVLLIPQDGSSVTTVEVEVIKQTSGTFLDEKSNVLVSRDLRQ